MKTIIQTIIASFRQGFGLVPGNTCHRGSNVVVAGYSVPSLDRARPEKTAKFGRHKATILYADVAYYTRLMEEDEIGTHRRLVQSLEFITAEINANGGRIAHLAGDAVLAEFEDPGSALHCAINVQLAARQWNATLPLQRQMLFRIGINSGHVIADRGDIFGSAVNLTERLEKLANRGGICVSESIRAELANHPCYRFIAMGKQYVKNLDEPVIAFWIEMNEASADSHLDVDPMSISTVAS